MAGNGVRKLLKSRTARIILLCLAALVLLLAVWKIFFRDSATATALKQTELEARLCAILTEVEGVSGATAFITEENGVPVGAVIVFEGNDGILTRMRVLEITAHALGIEKSRVQVYPANQ